MKISLSLFLGCLVVCFFCDCFSADRVGLIVMRSPDPSGLSPSSKLYVATLQNDTKLDIVLEAVQMPGGYVGSGTFFNCSLEQWDHQKKVWNVVRHESLAGFVKTNRKFVRIKPGGREEVCRNLLPHDAGSPGSCMRFRLERSWENGEDPFVSTPFVVGEAPSSNRCPSEGNLSKKLR
jgi:hypothetical protein